MNKNLDNIENFYSLSEKGKLLHQLFNPSDFWFNLVKLNFIEG